MPIGPPQRAASGLDGLAIASLVLGVLCMACLCQWVISIPAGILAIVFGVVARPSRNAELAKAGMVCGIVGMSLNVVFVLFIASLVFSSGSGHSNYRSVRLGMSDQQVTDTLGRPASTDDCSASSGKEGCSDYFYGEQDSSVHSRVRLIQSRVTYATYSDSEGVHYLTGSGWHDGKGPGPGPEPVASPTTSP
jgi:hypothetical protein